jgi:hypothetical protein
MLKGERKERLGVAWWWKFKREGRALQGFCLRSEYNRWKHETYFYGLYSHLLEKQDRE